jgi:hypothetical protein
MGTITAKMLSLFAARSSPMETAVAAWEDVYARADGVIKPAVFGVLDKLGWHLTPSARARIHAHRWRQKARGVRLRARARRTHRALTRARVSPPPPQRP